MIICPVYLCVFYLSFLEIGLVKIEFVALFSDKCYFICLASVTWHFVKVDFAKKRLYLKTISFKWHSGNTLFAEMGFPETVFHWNAI